MSRKFWGKKKLAVNTVLSISKLYFEGIKNHYQKKQNKNL